MSRSRFALALPLRVALVLTLFPVLLAGVLGYVLLEVQHEQVERALLARYETAAQSLAIAVAVGEGTGADSRIDEMLEELSEDENLAEIEIVGPSGKTRRVAGRAADPDLELDRPVSPGVERVTEEVGPEPEGFLHHEGHFVAILVPVDPSGVVRVVYSTRQANREVAATARWGLAILGAGLLLGLLLAWRFDRRIRRIVRELASAAGKIAGGDLAERARIRSGDDLERLAGTINELAVQLVMTRHELDQRNRRLSQLLDARTKALRVAEDLAAHHEEMAEAGLLAAGLAHEIGNPLASISGVAQRMMEGEIDEQRRERVGRILGLVDRIEAVLRGLMDFATAEDLGLEEVDAFDLARQALELARERPGAARVGVRIDEPAGPCRVRAPAERLRQVFLNLTINAIESIEGDGLVSIRAEIERDEVRIDIADTGVGMAPEVARHIFNPFFTTRRSGARKGIGLGLAISYGIVRRLGGRIEVESAPGGGSTFSVVLPAASASSH